MQTLRQQNDELEVQNHRQIQELTRMHRLHVASLQQQLTWRDVEIQQLKERFANWIIEISEVHLSDLELGRGAYGWVKEGTLCSCKVAVKCLHREIISDYNLQAFNREMNMATRCRHPNLLQFIGATRDTDRPPYIVTELMFTSLRQVLES